MQDDFTFTRNLFLLFRGRSLLLHQEIMSAKAINEATGKNLLNNCLSGAAHVNCRFASVDQTTSYDKLAQQNPWLLTEVSEHGLIFVMSGDVMTYPECGSIMSYNFNYVAFEQVGIKRSSHKD